MSIKLPIVNVKDINWNNHDSSFNMFQDIMVGDIAVIENKSECVLPLDDGEYCVTIDNENVFIEESFSYEECKILFGEEFGKSYKYMISLLTDNCYGDYIYGKYIEGDGCPVGADFTYAVNFDNAGDEVLRVFWLGMCNGFISAYGEENFPEYLVDRWKIIYKQMKQIRSNESV